MHVAYDDLREFISMVDGMGELRRIDGAGVLHEIGGITEVAAGAPHCPALLFDRIPGFEPGFRIFTNATTSVQRAALALGIDPHLPAIEILKIWKSRRSDMKPLPPRKAGSAPVLENSFAGATVDLGRPGGDHPNAAHSCAFGCALSR